MYIGIRNIFFLNSEDEHEKKSEDDNTHGHGEADVKEDPPVVLDIHIDTFNRDKTDSAGPSDSVIVVYTEYAGPPLVVGDGGVLVDKALAGVGQSFFIILKNVEHNPSWSLGCFWQFFR